MQTFTDTENRTWTLNLTIGAVKRVRDELKVNLMDPLGGARPGNSNGRRRRPPLLTRLQLDPILLVAVIFVLVKPEADRQGVTDEQFAEALGGDAAYDAFVAFMAEWRGFFQRLRRETEAKAIDANLAMVAAEDKRTAALVPRATEAAQKAAERRRQEAIEKIEALGDSVTATSSPESSGSGPATSTP